MARPIKTEEGRDIRQSNYITTAQYEYTAQEKRILYRVVEKAFEFRMQNTEYFAAHEGEYAVKEHVSFTMPIASFMPRKTDLSGKDYDEVVDAFKSLVDKRISFRGKGEFSFGGILNSADRNKGEGTIYFVVHKFVWQSALDFSKGFTKLELAAVMQFKSTYTMRFYEFAKQWSDRMHYTITKEDFKKMFGCQDKYHRMESIKRCIIDVAKKELDAKSSISFTYECNKVGKKIESFTFHFHELRKNKSEEQETKDLLIKYPNAALSREFKEFLSHKMTFTPAELNHNIKLFHEFEKEFRGKAIDELEETFQYITKMQKRPKDNKGLFISNIKKKLEWEQRQLHLEL
ncbi:MAG: replication initiation protein [Phocaeicola sp.]